MPDQRAINFICDFLRGYRREADLNQFILERRDPFLILFAQHYALYHNYHYVAPGIEREQYDEDLRALYANIIRILNNYGVNMYGVNNYNVDNINALENAEYEIAVAVQEFIDTHLVGHTINDDLPWRIADLFLAPDGVVDVLTTIEDTAYFYRFFVYAIMNDRNYIDENDATLVDGILRENFNIANVQNPNVGLNHDVLVEVGLGNYIPAVREIPAQRARNFIAGFFRREHNINALNDFIRETRDPLALIIAERIVLYQVPEEIDDVEMLFQDIQLALNHYGVNPIGTNNNIANIGMLNEAEEALQEVLTMNHGVRDTGVRDQIIALAMAPAGAPDVMNDLYMTDYLYRFFVYRFLQITNPNYEQNHHLEARLEVLVRLWINDFEAADDMEERIVQIYEEAANIQNNLDFDDGALAPEMPQPTFVLETPPPAPALVPHPANETWMQQLEYNVELHGILFGSYSQ